MSRYHAQVWRAYNLICIRMIILSLLRKMWYAYMYFKIQKEDNIEQTDVTCHVVPIMVNLWTIVKPLDKPHNNFIFARRLVST